MPFCFCHICNTAIIKMQKKDKIWTIIVRYLDESLSDDDNQRLQNWLNKDGKNRKVLASVKKLWESTDSQEKETLFRKSELEKDWRRISDHIQNREEENQNKIIWHFRKISRRKSILIGLLKVAAVILVAALSAFFTLQFASDGKKSDYKPVIGEIVTQRGERANVQLSDGTNVYLNADSKLFKPENFSTDRRVVEMTGQAYFEVTPDPERPFVIKSNGLEIEVLGTSFDVNTYEENSEFMVSVREGRVELRGEKTETEKLILNAGEVGIYSNPTQKLTSKIIEDFELYFGWMNGRLVFNNQSVRDVMKRIERWYDITVYWESENSEIYNRRLTADLKTKSIRDLMDVISAATGISYEIENDLITIK